MKNEYRFIEKVNREQFHALAEKEGVKAHFVGTMEWGEVCGRRGWTPYYVGMEKNGELAATAVLLQKRLFFGYSYFYIPRGFVMDYKDRELLREMTKGVDGFCRKRGSLYFKIDPDIKLHTIDLDGNVIEGEKNYDLSDYLIKLGYKRKPLNYFFENEQPRFTFRIPLDGTIEEIEARYSRTTKARIKQANNSGVEVVVGGKEDLKEFTRLMAMTEKRQDFFSHDKEYYSYFYDILNKSDMVTLYLGKIDIPKLKEKRAAELEALNEELEGLAEATGKKAVNRKKELEKKQKALKEQLKGLQDKPQKEIVVSAYLVSKYKDKSWALYAANDMDYGKFYANYAVYQRQIRDAHDEGRKIFDVFGTIGKPGSDSRLLGLYEFKKKWGGEYMEFIGEFDYIEKKFLHLIYKTLIPIYHKAVNRKLRKQVQKYEG